MSECTIERFKESGKEISRFLSDNLITYGVECFLVVYSMKVPKLIYGVDDFLDFVVVTIENGSGEIVEDLAGIEMITVSTDREDAIELMAVKCKDINDIEDENYER